MFRAAVGISVLVTLALVAGFFFWSPGNIFFVSKRDTTVRTITKVAFAQGAATGILEERRGDGYSLTVIDLTTGQPVVQQDYEHEQDKTYGLERLVGAGGGVLWAVSRSLGIHGRDLSSGRLIVRREEILARNPQLAPALTGAEPATFFFDLKTQQLVIKRGNRHHLVDLEKLTAEAKPLAQLRLRSRGPQGYHAHRPYVDMPSGGRILFARLGKADDGSPQYDSVPTLVSQKGHAIRMNEQLKLAKARFVYDSASDAAITLGRPPSVILVQSAGRAVSRLALVGSELWWRGRADLLPTSRKARQGARLQSAHLAGRRLVLHLGGFLVAVFAANGELSWSYPDP